MRRPLSVSLILAIALFKLIAAPPAWAATFVVTNTLGSGAGSLRQAILDANAAPGTDTITFDIPGPGPHTISGSGYLLSDPAIIDGYTQPGATPNTNPPEMGSNAVLKIEIKMTGTVSTAFLIRGGGSVIRGLAINGRISSGIHCENAGGNVISGNFIGTDVTGSLGATTSSARCVNLLSSSPGNLVGGLAPADRNVISGCIFGIGMSGVQTVQGNLIGLDAAGTARVAGSTYGIETGLSSGSVIGGTVPGARNVISGGFVGIRVTGTPVQPIAIQGNFIGTDVTGTIDVGNSSHGIDAVGKVLLGGPEPGAGNVISGNNGVGVQIEHDAVVQGNLIGTDLTGTRAIGNFFGVSVLGNNNEIGGTAPGARNVIAASVSINVAISRRGNRLRGNYIGTDVTGLAALGGEFGVTVSGTVNVIGGSEEGAGNIISGNVGLGVEIFETGEGADNVIQGNRIGAGAVGGSMVPNGGDGIRIRALRSTVGGPGPREGNLIVGNGGLGVSLTSCGSCSIRIQGNVISHNGLEGVLLVFIAGSAVLDNRIYGNGQLGIDVGGDGVSPNDPTENDGRQNFPELTLAVGETGLLEGVLDTLPNRSFEIQLFSSSTCDPSGYGEGEIILGSTQAVTDAAGHAVFSGSFPAPIPRGYFVTATATDPDGNTSEFSRCWPVNCLDDFDCDGLTDAQEAALGTDPRNADTDGDGLDDYDEVNLYKTNPLSTDTDGDGLGDGDEINTYKTSPLRTDSDGDGIPDAQEFAALKTSIYSVSSRDDRLRELDLQTGETLSSVVMILPGERLQLSNGGGGGEALAFDPQDGRLYRAAGNGVRNTPTGEIFEAIDFGPRTVTPILLSGSDYQEATSLTHWKNDLFLMSDQTRSFLGVTATGNVTFIAKLDHVSKGLAFLKDGRLFSLARDGGDLREIDPATGQTLTARGLRIEDSLALGHGDDGETMAFNPSDGLIYHASGSGTPNDPENGAIFEKVDFVQGTITPIALMGIRYNEATALTPAPDGTFLLGDLPGNLYRVTPGGAVTFVSDLGYTARGLAFRSDGTLYSISRTSTSLRTLDPLTGVTFTTVPVSLPGRLISRGIALAVDPLTDTLWAVLEVDDPDARTLVTLDPATGVAAPVGDLGDAFAGLTFDSAGTLYGLTGDGARSAETLCILSKADGTSHCVRALTGNGLTTHPITGELHGLLSFLGQGGRELVTIDPDRALAKRLGNTGARFSSLAFDAGGRLFGVTGHTAEQSELLCLISLPGLIHGCSAISNANGLARDPRTGELWAVLNLENGAKRELVKVDPETGATQRIGSTDDRFAGLAFDREGTLYGVTGDGAAIPETLFRLSTATAEPTPVLPLGNGTDGEAIAFDPVHGLLYHSSGLGPFNDPVDGTVFEVIDPANWILSNIPMSGDSIDESAALTHLLDDRFLLAERGLRLFEITTGGQVTELYRVDHESKGLAVRPLVMPFDIRPGDASNKVNVKSNALVPVAILSTETFDATTIDPKSICFGSAARPDQRDCTGASANFRLEDVNKDGQLDLVLRYHARTTGLDASDVNACFAGMARTGRPVEGCDRIQVLR